MAGWRAALGLAAALPGAAMAEAVPPGASSCLGCHAPARVDAVIPSLRGRDSAAVAAALRAWREGAEPGSVMERLAKGFSEAESRAIAAWLVAQ